MSRLKKSVKTLIYVLPVLILGVIVYSYVQPSSSKILAEEYFEKGLLHFNQKEYIVAIDHFYKSLEYQPNYYQSRVFLGKAYYQAGFLKNAMIEWERNIELGADDLYLSNKLGILEYRKSAKDNTDFEDKNYISIKSNVIKGEKDNNFINPCSIELKDSVLYVTGYSSKSISKFSKNGHLISRVNKSEKTPLSNPYDLAFNNQNNYYVSDYTGDTIFMFDRNDKLIHRIGKKGIDEGEFIGPKGIYIDKKDNIYISDSGNYRIQKFNKENRFLFMFECRKPDSKELFSPLDLTLSDDGTIYIIAKSKITTFYYILKYDKYGKYITSFGKDYLKKPVSIKYNKVELWICDSELGIYSYNPANKSWTEKIKVDKNDKDGLHYPIDFVYDNNLIFYVADFKKNLVLSWFPEHIRSHNIDVSIAETDINNFPLISQKVYIKDRTGESLHGLDESNFFVFENNKRQFDIKLERPNINNEKLSLVLVNGLVDKSPVFLEQAEKITRNIMKSFGNLDKIQIINASKEDQYVAQKFTNNMLSTVAALSKTKSSELPSANFFGGPIYKAISDSISRNGYKGAVIFLTAGNIDEKEMFPYGFDVYIDYASNNDVPIYILSFDQAEDDIPVLNRIAKETGGNLYNAYTSNEAFKLTDIIREHADNYYYLWYTTDNESISKQNRLRDLRVEVNFQGLMGQDKTKFYVYPIAGGND